MSIVICSMIIIPNSTLCSIKANDSDWFAGVMIMVHADNQGLVLPPRVALIQVNTFSNYCLKNILN